MATFKSNMKQLGILLGGVVVLAVAAPYLPEQSVPEAKAESASVEQSAPVGNQEDKWELTQGECMLAAITTKRLAEYRDMGMGKEEATTKFLNTFDDANKAKANARAYGTRDFVFSVAARNYSPTVNSQVFLQTCYRKLKGGF